MIEALSESGRSRALPLGDLLSDDPAWPLVESWLSQARHDVVVLPPTSRQDAEAVLAQLQVTTGSVLGAVAVETGGILIDHGWLRLLGSGSPAFPSSLANWNSLSEQPVVTPLRLAFVVGFDAVGGFFAINGGEFSGRQGDVFYFAPDTLAWESLERGYADFVHWALTADLETFYDDLRWPGWQDELGRETGDRGFALYPPPFTKEGRPVSKASRRLIPMTELWEAQHDVVRQLGAVPDGGEVRFRVEP